MRPWTVVFYNRTMASKSASVKNLNAPMDGDKALMYIQGILGSNAIIAALLPGEFAKTVITPVITPQAIYSLLI